jgi:general secretion pathway protein A
VYLNFYNLKREPFQITPDPEFLYLSPKHKEALAAILYGVKQRKGFVAIIGEVGVGKTTILRSYMEEVSKENLRIVYIFNANVTFGSLLKMVFRDLDLVPGTDDTSEMVNQLHEYLIEEYKEDRNVVLIIDEAQNIPVGTFESLRMLSNLESSTEKLIQIVLVGQPELEKKLDLKELRQLKQRIAVKATISPLSQKESMDYVLYRLAKGGTKDAPIFTKKALGMIVRHSKGIPRTINILCDSALVTGFGYQRKRIGYGIVREVIADFGREERGLQLSWRVACLLIALLVVFALWVWLFTDRQPILSYLGVLLQFESLQGKASYKQEDPNELKPHPVGLIKLQASPTERPGGALGSRVAFPQIRTVRRGDTLTGLIESVYGHSDRKLIESLQKSNPGIKDINQILVGQEITFPEPKEEP